LFDGNLVLQALERETIIKALERVYGSKHEAAPRFPEPTWPSV